MSTQIYSSQFKELSHTFHSYILSEIDQSSEPSNKLIDQNLSHEEMVSQALIEFLEEYYDLLNKEEKDSAILMLMENELLE